MIDQLFIASHQLSPLYSSDGKQQPIKRVVGLRQRIEIMNGVFGSDVENPQAEPFKTPP